MSVSILSYPIGINRLVVGAKSFRKKKTVNNKKQQKKKKQKKQNNKKRIIKFQQDEKINKKPVYI